MNRHRLITAALVAIFGGIVFAPCSADAKVTPDQRKLLSAISKDAKKLTRLASKKQFDELKTQLEEIEKRIAEVGIAEDDKTDRSYRLLQSSIAKLKSRIPVSFEKSVAPILKDNCVSCHSQGTKRGKLALDTFAGMRQGGTTKPLLIPKNANRSVFALRLIAAEKNRMPKGKPALKQEEIQTIANWINQGAIFDGEDPNAVIGAEPKPEPKPPAKIVMADGTETVSFVKDIAPWMTNLCVRCHRGNTPRGGYSMETFEKLMQGGDSGIVVHGGDLDASRMWDLAGLQKPIKMPPGQARIKVSNHANLKKWIQEGAKFDGKDPKALLSSLVPSAADTMATQLASMSAEEFAKRRSEQAASMWKKVMPSDEAKQVETEQFLIYGNVPEPRLKEIGEWSEAHAEALTEMFGKSGDQIWRGRLIVFVTDDRFAYEEFNQVLLNRRSPKELTGHSVVTKGFDEAYVAMEDVGNESDSKTAGMKLNLIDHLTGAYLKRGGGTLPDWMVRGTGLVMAAKAEPKNPFMKSLPLNAARSIKAMGRPNALFNDGTFSPGEIGGVGYTAVSFLLKQGGPRRFGQLVKQVTDGKNMNAAMKTVYGSTAAEIGARLFSAL